MNTEYLRYILTIDEYKSINRASKELYITQPTLSRILQSVEKDIGIAIFRRTNQGVETTEEGAEFIQRIRHMLSEVDMILRDYFDTDNPPEDMATLIIGAQRSSPAMEACLLYYKERGCRAKHLNLVFQEENAETIMDGVSSGLLDIGVIHFISSRENEILQWCDKNGITCDLIDESNLYAQIRATHPLAEKSHIEINDLKPFLHVTFSDEDLSGVNCCSNISRFDWHAQNRRIVTNNRGALHSFILNSDGYYLGNNAQCKLFDMQNTVAIPVVDYPYTIKTVSIHRNEKTLSDEERLYLSYLSEIYSSIHEKEK